MARVPFEAAQHNNVYDIQMLSSSHYTILHARVVGLLKCVITCSYNQGGVTDYHDAYYSCRLFWCSVGDQEHLPADVDTGLQVHLLNSSLLITTLLLLCMSDGSRHGVIHYSTGHTKQGKVEPLLFMHHCRGT